MRAHEAWEVAGKWLTTEWLPEVEREGKAHGFAGAYIMGSLAALPAEAEFKNLASDIDVALLVDPDVLPTDRERYPHGKFTLFGECQIQAIFLPLTALEAEERLLTMLGLGCNLKNAHVLADPLGRIERARAVVLEHWGADEWTARRLERAKEFASGAMDRMAAESAPIGRLGAYCDGMMQIAGLPAIATRETPTHRRCLVRARAIMADRGREDLYDRLLGVVGAQRVDASTVEAVVADSLVALDIEQRHGKAAVDLSAEFRAALPEATAASVFDLVEDGWEREAILPALGNLSMSSAIVARVGSKTEVASLEEMAVRNLERVGISDEGWGERAKSARALTDEIGRWCSELVSGA